MPQVNISDFSAVLFDLDGVIVDTEGQYSLFWKQIGEEFSCKRAQSSLLELPSAAENVKKRCIYMNEYKRPRD